MKDTLDLLFLDLNPSLETSDSFLLLPYYTKEKPKCSVPWLFRKRI